MSTEVSDPHMYAEKLLQMCKTHRIALQHSSNKRIISITKTMTKYFSLTIKDGYLESVDRRFTLSPHGLVIYQHDTKEIKMSILKLIASLTLTTSKLFRFLTSTAYPQKLKQYSSSEKLCIRSFVRLTGISRRCIPCLQVRTLCT